MRSKAKELVSAGHYDPGLTRDILDKVAKTGGSADDPDVASFREPILQARRKLSKELLCIGALSAAESEEALRLVNLDYLSVAKLITNEYNLLATTGHWAPAKSALSDSKLPP